MFDQQPLTQFFRVTKYIVVMGKVRMDVLQRPTVNSSKILDANKMILNVLKFQPSSV